MTRNYNTPLIMPEQGQVRNMGMERWKGNAELLRKNDSKDHI